MPPTSAELDKGFKALDDAEAALKDARGLMNSAQEAAFRCDRERATRLKRRALDRGDDVERLLGTIPADVLAFYARDDTIRRILAGVRDLLGRVDALLARCGGDKSSLPFRYVRGGTFGGTRVEVRGPEAMAGPSADQILWRFDLAKDPRCRCLCLVSVFHIERADTGEIVRPMSAAFVDFDPPYGLPHDGRDVDGYSVDAGIQKYAEPPAPLTLVPRPCPCDLTQTSVPANHPTRIEGVDSPTVRLRLGLVFHFETALVCLDRRPYRMLGSMRWMKDKTELTIVKDGASIDWGDASEPFKRALYDWLTRYGSKCCPD